MQKSRKEGFTLVELMIVVAIAGALVGVSFPALVSWMDEQRAKDGAKSVANLLATAREGAVRSGVPHLVFFRNDAADDDNILVDADGQEVAAVVIKDDDGDGAPDATEIVATLPLALGGNVIWGSQLADESAPDDPEAVPGEAPDEAWTFSEPDNSDARWVLYQADGIPRAFTVDGGFSVGVRGSGSGAVYLSNGRKDYAVVLAPLGGVRLNSWNDSQGRWE